ncbi:uncharacterized protein N7487_007280 [Penicillium crustosum]|uniref:uncharacterized protein n=1 Tax=Penicillium crustosum TaxID=36656 RepID=UPI002390A191|nr:uncharacterized protein N7487_007280 [Penicillium crustosum]KAJ5401384.1 hypothetical protein N7487_007280 [Penicillium crustosum]
MMSPLGLLLNHCCIQLFVTSTSFLYFKAVKRSNIKAVRPREHLEAYLIQAELGDLRFLKSNGVCESL